MKTGGRTQGMSALFFKNPQFYYTRDFLKVSGAIKIEQRSKINNSKVYLNHG